MQLYTWRGMLSCCAVCEHALLSKFSNINELYADGHNFLTEKISENLSFKSIALGDTELRTKSLKPHMDALCMQSAIAEQSCELQDACMVLCGPERMGSSGSVT